MCAVQPRPLPLLLLLLLLPLSLLPPLAAGAPLAALLVSSSRYWHNYRHSANALVFYAALRRLGLPDDAIALHLAADAPHACDARSAPPPHRCALRTDAHGASLLPSAGPGGGAGAQVDLSGAAATAGAVLRALTGRLGPGEGGSLPGMEGGGGSGGGGGSALRLLLVLTGHGGDGYLKFHDKDELSYADLAGALREAHAAGRYGALLVVADTCHAASLGAALRACRAPRWHSRPRRAICLRWSWKRRCPRQWARAFGGCGCACATRPPRAHWCGSMRSAGWPMVGWPALLGGSGRLIILRERTGLHLAHGAGNWSCDASSGIVFAPLAAATPSACACGSLDAAGVRQQQWQRRQPQRRLWGQSACAKTSSSAGQGRGARLPPFITSCFLQYI